METKKKSLVENTVFNVIYTMSNIVFPLISSMYVARVLLAVGVGKIAYAQNIASYFVTIGALGLPTYGIREVAKVSKSREKTDKTFTELMIINTLSTTIALIVYVFIVYSLSEDQSSRTLFIICGLQIVLNYINVDWFYQGKEEYKYITVRSLVIKTLSFGSLFVFVKNENDYLIYALINVLASGGNYLFNIWNLRRYTRIVFKRVTYEGIRKHLSPLFILAFSILLSSIYSKVDTTMLGALTSEEEVGFYTYAHRMPEMIIVLCTSITAVFLPRLSLYYKEEPEKFYELINLGVQILCFFSIPASVGFWVLAPEVLSALFGEAFVPAIITARVFSILIIIKSFGNLLCYQLVICTGNEKKRLPAYGLAAGINIGLNAILIPRLGATGAAISSVLSELIVNGVQMLSIIKVVDLRFPKKPIIDACISSVLMTVCVMLVKCRVMTGLITLIAGVLSGILVYVLVNILMKNKVVLVFAERFILRKGRRNNNV